jgi:hypothetical protein
MKTQVVIPSTIKGEAKALHKRSKNALESSDGERKHPLSTPITKQK